MREERMQPNQPQASSLDEIVAAQKRGQALGIPSICSAHPAVLLAAMQQACTRSSPLLIESTSNQVNQFGGYTGQTPAQFYAFVQGLARQAGLAGERLILGGDHLGPNPWQGEPAEIAMAKARQLVADCVHAGYHKIHLDASMRLGDDPADGPSGEVSAQRAAEMCQAAETAWRELRAGGAPAPRYIVGTEVPLPGGEVAATPELQVSRSESAEQTLVLTRAAFRRSGLESAWERVIGLVVQPGVEFGDRTVHAYRPEKAAALSHWIESVPGIVFEAHSTDYQTPQALAGLVSDHFAILKVGPGLTFALREALFALEGIEIELLRGEPESRRSHLQDVLEAEMLANPGNWQRYYPGSAQEQRLMRRFSLSDRIRYYWPAPAVQAAQSRLMANLREGILSPGVVSQYFPEWSDFSAEPPTLECLIEGRIRRVLDGYWDACTPSSL
jgi:D-tagatose-1,6-bisphosphate aldolase subunit GatZ/KbaZ